MKIPKTRIYRPAKGPLIEFCFNKLWHPTDEYIDSNLKQEINIALVGKLVANTADTLFE